MIVPNQSRLPMLIASNTALVSVDTARAVLGVDGDTIYGLCQDGSLSHTYDLYSRGDGELANIRIWAESVSARQRLEPQPSMPDAEVLEIIVGMRASTHISCVTLAQRFLLHRASVLRWHQSGHLAGIITGGILKFRREDVIRFLQARRFR